MAVTSNHQDTESKDAVASNAEHKDDTKIQDANGDENVDEDQEGDNQLSSDENPEDGSKISDDNANEGESQGMLM